MLKKIIKLILLGIANTAVYWFILKANIFPSQYKGIAIELSTYNGIFGILLRRCFYKKTLAACGDDFTIGYGSYICYPTAVIGSHVAIEEYCIISNCTIGNYVVIAANVSIMSGTNHHDIYNLDVPLMLSKGPINSITLGTDIWIGTHAVVMADISDGVVIGAGSVVNKTFPKQTVIAGVPAKIIRSRIKQ